MRSKRQRKRKEQNSLKRKRVSNAVGDEDADEIDVYGFKNNDCLKDT